MVKKRSVTSVAAMGSPAFSAGAVYVPGVLRAVLPGPLCGNPAHIDLADMPPFAPEPRPNRRRAVKH